MTGRRATVRPGHQAAAVAPPTARSTVRRDQSPRNAEPVDAMVDRGLERRGQQDPEPEARDRPEQGGERPDDRAVSHEDEANVLVRGPDGGEHAELAEPSLGDDCESCCGDQRGEEEEDGSHGEHRQRLFRAADVASANTGAGEGPALLVSVTQRLVEGLLAADSSPAPTRTLTCVRRMRRRGGDESELVAQLARVLHDADDRPANAVERQRRSELEPQRAQRPHR